MRILSLFSPLAMELLIKVSALTFAVRNLLRIRAKDYPQLCFEFRKQKQGQWRREDCCKSTTNGLEQQEFIVS